MTGVASSNSDEEKSFGETLKKKSLLLLIKTVSNFITHSNTSPLRLNTDELFLHVWKYMFFFRRKLQRNLRNRFWKSDVLASLTPSDHVSLLSVKIWQQCYWEFNQTCYSNFVAIIYWSRLLSVLLLKWSSMLLNQIYRARVHFD